jgi:thiamine biosynthesis lipoprotein
MRLNQSYVNQSMLMTPLVGFRRYLVAIGIAFNLMAIPASDIEAANEKVVSTESDTKTNIYNFYREHVLGTSMQWTVHAPNQMIAEQSEKWLIDEIQRLSDVLSRHNSSSELSLLPRESGSQAMISHDLAQVLSAAEQYRVKSRGAFDVRSSWFEHSRNWRLENRETANAHGNRTGKSGLLSPHHPSPSHLPQMHPSKNKIAEMLNELPYRVEQGSDGDYRLENLQDNLATWTLDGIAKGYILDQVAYKSLMLFPEISGGCINIGGDLRLFGEFSLSVSIDNPFRDHEGSDPLITWKQSTSTAIATSGGYRRRIEDESSTSRSHLIDPRTGDPAEALASVTVIAKTAMQADALATTVSVLGKEEGLLWIDSITYSGVACLMVDTSGQIHTSSHWYSITQSAPPSHVQLSAAQSGGGPLHSGPPKNELPAGLHVWFELARPKDGSYRRPYLAIWLEDEEGFSVKTAALWLQSEQPGPRWHRDLSRWYRNDRMRKLAEDSELIATVSSATRGPGRYEVHFDGTDNKGNPLAPGIYTLLIEVAREHGTYQLIRQSFRWGDQAIERTPLEGNIEISHAAFRFQPCKGTGAE